MCGSGLVVRKALDTGHVGIGIDIDPLAVLMARVWTTRISNAIRPDCGTVLAREARELLRTDVEIPWIDNDEETSAYIDFWFLPRQREQLRALIAAGRILRGQRRDLFDLALSRIIVTKARGASVAADVSHSRPHRVRTTNDYDVLAGFERSFARLLKILRNSPVEAKGSIRLGDAAKLRGIRTESVDAVITSPPYLNAIDYLRGHKLSLVWLGYSIDQIRGIKSSSVGNPALGNSKEIDTQHEIANSSISGEASAGTRRLVLNYVSSMLSCLRQTHRVLREGGYAVYVTSNSVHRGSEIDTARIIADSAAAAGLRLESRYIREIPRQRRYLPPPDVVDNRQLAARMRTESVLRFAKGR